MNENKLASYLRKCFVCLFSVLFVVRVSRSCYLLLPESVLELLFVIAFVLALFAVIEIDGIDTSRTTAERRWRCSWITEWRGWRRGWSGGWVSSCQRCRRHQVIEPRVTTLIHGHASRGTGHSKRMIPSPKMHRRNCLVSLGTAVHWLWTVRLHLDSGHLSTQRWQSWLIPTNLARAVGGSLQVTNLELVDQDRRVSYLMDPKTLNQTSASLTTRDRWTSHRVVLLKMWPQLRKMRTFPFKGRARRALTVDKWSRLLVRLRNRSSQSLIFILVIVQDWHQVLQHRSERLDPWQSVPTVSTDVPGAFPGKLGVGSVGSLIATVESDDRPGAYGPCPPIPSMDVLPRSGLSGGIGMEKLEVLVMSTSCPWVAFRFVIGVREGRRRWSRKKSILLPFGDVKSTCHFSWSIGHFLSQLLIRFARWPSRHHFLRTASELTN